MADWHTICLIFDPPVDEPLLGEIRAAWEALDYDAPVRHLLPSGIQEGTWIADWLYSGGVHWRSPLAVQEFLELLEARGVRGRGFLIRGDGYSVRVAPEDWFDFDASARTARAEWQVRSARLAGELTAAENAVLAAARAEPFSLDILGDAAGQLLVADNAYAAIRAARPAFPNDRPPIASGP